MTAKVTCPSCGRAVDSSAEACSDCGTRLLVVAADATQRKDALVGATLGEFQVLKRVGMGGMGIVYEGLQPVIGKRVAIKVLRPDIADSPSEVKRLLEEARTVNAIGHRGIIDIFSFGQT